MEAIAVTGNAPGQRRLHESPAVDVPGCDLRPQELRDDYWHVGGGLSCTFSRADVYASYIAFAGGTDTHAGRALLVGVSWPFEFGHAHAP